MALLHVAVLVRMARLDRLAREAVVPQQCLVTLRERRRAFSSRRDRRRQPVRPMPLRHAAQFPQSVLQAVAEALVALGEADRPRLPVRVRQHEVIDQVVERHAEDGHAQLGAVREIAGTQPSRVMDLGEEHFFGRSLQGAPLLEASLQGPHLAVSEASGEASLQVGEQGLGLQSRVESELRFELRPDLGERVGPRAIVPLHASHLTGQLAEPAVLARGLGVHAGLVSRASLGQSLKIEPSESSHLVIGEHPEPPVRVGSDQRRTTAGAGNLVVVGERSAQNGAGNLVAVGRDIQLSFITLRTPPGQAVAAGAARLPAVAAADRQPVAPVGEGRGLRAVRQPHPRRRRPG